MPDGGGDSTQTSEFSTQSSRAPWEPVQQDILDFLGQARGEYENPPEFFPGETYVPMDPRTQEALTGAEERARAGSPLVGQASDVLSGMMGEGYQDAGRGYLNDVTQAAANTVLPGMIAGFQAGGRSDSPAMARAVSQGLGTAVAPYAANLYNQAENRRMSAAGMAPGMADAQYADLTRLADIGGVYEDYDRQELADEMARHQFGENVGYNQLARYFPFLAHPWGEEGTSSGTQTTTTSGGGPGVFEQVAGGLLGAAGLGLQAAGPFGPFGASGAFGAASPQMPGISGAGTAIGGRGGLGGGFNAGVAPFLMSMLGGGPSYG